jgi:hypothetical protein
MISERRFSMRLIHQSTPFILVVHRCTKTWRMTPSSSKEVPSDIAIHNSKEGVKGGKQSWKPHPQGTTTDHDDGNHREASGSVVSRIWTTTHSDKCQLRPPTDHFKRLLEEASPNDTNPARHKLKDYVMMRSFITSGSHTWVAELNKDPGGSDMMPFLGENVVMPDPIGEASCV